MLGIVLEKQGKRRSHRGVQKALELNPASTIAKARLDELTKPAAARTIRHASPKSRATFATGSSPTTAAVPQYVTERPASTWGWYALGYSQFAQQKIGESIRALAKSLELDVTNAEAHKILGRNLMIIGRFDAAQIEFEQGIRYKPDSAEIHYNLGKLLSIQDNWEPARKEFEAALRIDPPYVEAMDALGLALEALGDDAGAVATYRRRSRSTSERNGTLRAGAREPERLLQPHRRSEQGARVRDEGAGARPAIRPRAISRQGRADERQGQLDAAVTALNAAIALNPRASSYYYVLAGVYRRLGMDGRKQESPRHVHAPRQGEHASWTRSGGAAAEAAVPDAAPR